MVKKITFSLIAWGLILCVALQSNAHAQTRYDELLLEYYQAFDTYRTELSRYEKAKAEYEKFDTFVARENAIEVTQEFLPARQQVMITYLKMMRERLEQTPLLTDEEVSPRLRYLNDEIEWLEEHQQKYNTADNLNTLVGISKQAESRYGRFLQEANLIKGLVALSKMRSLDRTGEELINLTSEQVARVRSEGVDTIQMDRWLLDVNEKMVLAQDSLATNTKNFRPGRSPSHPGQQVAYRNLQNSYGRTIQLYREMIHLLNQIIADIRFD